MDKAQAALMQGPIPGQSLTDEPKAFAWEQPPQINDPEDVLDFYVAKISDPEVSDNVLDMIDLGLPISVVADAMLSKGIMDGIHTVDMKLLVKPQIGMLMKRMAEEANIDYKETMDDYRDKDAEAKMRRMKKLSAKLAIRTSGDMDKGDVIQQEVAETIVEQPAEEPAQGLMAKEQ